MWGVLNESGKIDKSEMTVGPRIEDRKVQKYVGPRFEPECDIRENFDTNDCANIFVSTKLHE